MKILIVDDHDLFAEGLKLLIESLSDVADIQLTNSFQGGIEALAGDELFDLVLLDYRLPDAPADSIASFCGEAPATPVVVISSEDGRDVIRMAIHSGAAGYIPKSSNKEVLVNAIEQVLRGGTFLPNLVLEDFESQPENEKIATLTQQQKKVLSYIVKGVSNKVIASQLEIAEGTVKAHLHNVYKLLSVKNRTEAVLAVAKHKMTFDD